MKLFIAGCGRSGTTLIRDLMNCFADTYVLNEGEYGEAPYSRFRDLAQQEKHLVIKRTGECWKTLPDLPNDIELIYCVRHPFDVLTSAHPLTKHVRRFHIDYERWVVEYNALLMLRVVQPSRNIFYLKYEEIVNNPDHIQETLSRHFELIKSHRFANNPLGIQVLSTSVDKWKRDPDLFDYLRTTPHRYRSLMSDFCKDFEYELPAGYAQGYAASHRALALINIYNPNGLELLDGQPFFWLGDSQTILDIYSACDKNIRLLFEALMGSSFSGQRHLRIDSKDWNLVVVVQSGPVELEIPIWNGENQVLLSVLEKPNSHAASTDDRRPLMLGVLNLRVDG